MPNDDETETVRNEERGCGFLKHGKAYVRFPPRSADDLVRVLLKDMGLL